LTQLHFAVERLAEHGGVQAVEGGQMSGERFVEADYLRFSLE